MQCLFQLSAASAHAHQHPHRTRSVMQSNYWKDWDLSARFSYTGGDANVFGYNQTLVGRESRTNLRNDQSRARSRAARGGHR